MSSVNSSYFCKNETKYGWGESYFFTYFSEFQREWTGTIYIEVIALLTLFSLASIGNILIIYITVKYKNMKSVTNYFVCNLAIASVLYCFGAPFIAFTRVSQTWLLGGIMCHLLVYIEFVGAYVSIWTMTLISIDRFRRIVQYAKNRMQMVTCVVMLVILWGVSGLAFIPSAVYFEVLDEISFQNTTVKICTLVWPKYDNIRVAYAFTIPVVITAFILPLIIMTHNYTRVLYTFWISKKRLLSHRMNHKPGHRNTGSNSSATSMLKTDKKACKIIKILILIVVLFFVMWLPIFIIFALVVYELRDEGSIEDLTLRSSTFITTLTFTYANAVLNPILYCSFNDKLRNHFKAIWLTVFCCVCCANFKSCFFRKNTSITVSGKDDVFQAGATKCETTKTKNLKTAEIIEMSEMSGGSFSNFNN